MFLGAILTWFEEWIAFHRIGRGVKREGVEGVDSFAPGISGEKEGGRYFSFFHSTYPIPTNYNLQPVHEYE